MKQTWPKPVIGFAGFSGSGKTTLISQLLPLLSQQGLAVSVLKHSHHQLELDKPGKDSQRFVRAGASEVLLACPNRRYHFSQQDDHDQLNQQLDWLNWQQCDLVLVEGYRHSNMAKIEVHRPALGKPLLYPEDNNIIAIASDQNIDCSIPYLNLNQTAQVAEFILSYIRASY